jgi:hypothetical protein
MSKFKIHEKTYLDVPYFMRYMGSDVEGQLKWYIWSPDVCLDEFVDTLWYSKEEARMSAEYAIFCNLHGKSN